jgi:hypothetical protein
MPNGLRPVGMIYSHSRDREDKVASVGVVVSGANFVGVPEYPPVRVVDADVTAANAVKPRRPTMKTMLLIAAVIGIALGAGAMSPAAHASNVHLYPPADDNGQG